MKTEIKTTINSLAAKTFAITAAFIIPAALMLATGNAQGSLKAVPAAWLMVIAAITFVATSTSKSGVKAGIK